MTKQTQLKHTDRVFGFYLKPKLLRRPRRVTTEAIDLQLTAGAASKLIISADPVEIELTALPCHQRLLQSFETLEAKHHSIFLKNSLSDLVH